VTRGWERAVRRGDIGALERLWILEKPDIDARNAQGQTALMIAALEGHGSTISWLIERGAALNVTAKYGLSALMLAVVRDHADAARRLLESGADTRLLGTGAPGFANKTALDLAIDRNNDAVLDALRSTAGAASSHQAHFATVPSWEAARPLLMFQPLRPEYTAGAGLQALRIHVKDHKSREVPIGDRTLEAHYDQFVLSQARKGVDEARRLAFVVSYGRAPRKARIAGHEARVYERGPEPDANDPDGRLPAVVTWHDGEMFYLLASDHLLTEVLVTIGDSLYADACN
jgi:ankyrin repeat protein